MVGKPVLALVDHQISSASLGMLDGIEQSGLTRGPRPVSADLTAGSERWTRAGQRMYHQRSCGRSACPAASSRFARPTHAGQVLVGLIFLVAAFGLRSIFFQIATAVRRARLRRTPSGYGERLASGNTSGVRDRGRMQWHRPVSRYSCTIS